MRYIQTNGSFVITIEGTKTNFIGNRLFAKNNLNKHD